MTSGPRLAGRLAALLAVVGAGILFVRFIHGTQTGAALAAMVPSRFWAALSETFGARDAESAQVLEVVVVFLVGAVGAALVLLAARRALRRRT